MLSARPLALLPVFLYPKRCGRNATDCESHSGECPPCRSPAGGEGRGQHSAAKPAPPGRDKHHRPMGRPAESLDDGRILPTRGRSGREHLAAEVRRSAVRANLRVRIRRDRTYSFAFGQDGVVYTSHSGTVTLEPATDKARA